MTTTTPDSIALPADPTPARRLRLRFGVAFLVGLVATFAIGAGGLFAYEQQFAGRVLPGVRVGIVDVSGLEPAAAAERIRTAYTSIGEGSLVLTAGEATRTISYAAIGRRADVDALVAEAMAIGRDGNAVERVIADARTAIRGVVVEPRVTFDAEALSAELTAFAEAVAVEPRDAGVTILDDASFRLRYASSGQVARLDEPLAQALAAISAVDAPSRVELAVPLETVAPTVTTEEARTALSLANRLTAPIMFELDEDEERSIGTARLRGWLTFETTPDGGYTATLDTSKLSDLMLFHAKRIDREPVNASYTTKAGKITGVTRSRDGRTLDVEASVAQVLGVLAARTSGGSQGSFAPTFATVEPALTTAEAEAARSKMRKVSEWTTYFPVSEKNGFGANIWIPARQINGHVVAPGATFDFWDAVGEVTREKGYRDGGAIINGKTEPQGALAGGICSTSTTLFNAALRAGYEMGARRNHYYYIDRYPLGLDATVFISASGATQTMSFTNDTDYPILIRGLGWAEGSAGYVKFELYSVPNGRTVRLSEPIVENVRRATDTVEYTSALAPGVRERIEYPVDGKQVTVTRTVVDASGTLIHKNTYVSNYTRITGITLVGQAPR
ncbi:MAG: VanW family protein [Candidatus Limnocylindria bacterium]